jgi:hypothetical protein
LNNLQLNCKILGTTAKKMYNEEITSILNIQ